MDPQPMGKVRDLSRLAGRVAARSTVRWSSLRKFLGICLLAAVVGGPAVGLPHAQGAAAVAAMPRPAQGQQLLPQKLTFDQPSDTAVGQSARLSASTDADPNENLVVSFRSDTPDLCTVSGVTVTPTAPGFCVITATQDGDASYAPAPDVARAFLAHSGPEPQTITFDPPQAAAVGEQVRLSAATDADANENLVVSFRSDTPDVCTVSGVTVTATTADVCTITASQGGNEHYAAARPVRRSFQASTGTRRQTIRFVPPKVLAAGQQVTVSATTDAKTLGVSFRSESPMVCTVSVATVTTITAGMCDITAFQGGSAVYAPAQVSGSIQVMPNDDRAAQQISFDPVPGTTVGVPVVLTASSSPALQLKRSNSPTVLVVSFTSQNRRVCTVSGATVVPRAGGRCVIIAAQDGNARYLPATPVRREFPVARASQTVTFTPPASATIDQPVTLTATASSWLPVTYTSSTQDVCTVSGATLTPTAAGPCTVVASQPGNAQYAPADSRTGSVPVGKIPQTISFSLPGSATVDRRVTLTAKASSGLPVIYASGSRDVCTVEGSTLIPAKAGTCVITASQPGDGRYAPADSRTGSVPVGKIPQTISFSLPGSATVDRRVTLTARASSGLPVIYASGSRDVCTVEGSTLIPAKAGTCVITASQPGDGRYAPADSRTGSVPVGKIPQTISFSLPGSATVDRRVTLTARASSGLPVIYASGSRDVCTVEGSTLIPAKAGTCVITASQPGDGGYAPADSRTGSVPVGKIPQTISFTPPDGAEAGQRVTLSASATSNLAVSFASAAPGVCTVSGRTATTIRAGTCAVVASQAGDDRYAAAGSMRKSFPVALIPQTIDFRPPQDVAFGRPVTLIATASSGLPVSYRTSTPGVCTVAGRTVTTRAAGACAITASQAGDDRYAPARDAAQSFRVGRAAQTITFTPPDGTALGRPVTLSASASLRAGRVLPHGHSGGVHSFRRHRHPGHGRHLHYHRLPARQRQLRAGPGHIQVLPGPPRQRRGQEDPAGDRLRATLARSRRPPGPPGRVGHLGARSVVPIGHAIGVHGIWPHRHRDRGWHLRHHRLPGRRRPFRGSPRCAAILRRPRRPGFRRQQGPTTTRCPANRSSFGQLRAAAVGQVVALIRVGHLGARGVVPVGHSGGVLGVGATVTTTTAGTCTVTGSQAGDDRYLAAPDMTESFQVNAGHQAQTIVFPPAPQAKVGAAVTLSASATSGLLVAFRSDTPRICTVSGPTLTPIAAGTCTVTASQGGSDHYAAARDIAQSFDVASAASGFPGALTFLLGAVVFAAAGVTSLVRRVRHGHAARRSLSRLFALIRCLVRPPWSASRTPERE